MTSEATKERILRSSLRLFNQKGSNAVTTNHIADAAGLSSGNLYYHYANKEEIVRDLFMRMDAEWDRIFELPTDRPLDLETLQFLVESNFQTLWKYRFIYRELVTLIKNDPTLASDYRSSRKEGARLVRGLLSAFMENGLIRKRDDQALAELVDACWMVSEFWLVSLEIAGEKVDKANIQRGVSLMMSLIS